MKICNKCGGNLATTTNYNEGGKMVTFKYCENLNCITNSQGYEKEFPFLGKNLKAINPTKFCNLIGNKKAIKQNSQTRTKKRHIDRILKAQSILNLLGYKIVEK